MGRRALPGVVGVAALALVAGAAPSASLSSDVPARAALPGGLAAPDERVEEAEDEAEAARERLREAEAEAEASRRAAEEAEERVAQRLAELDVAAEAYEEARAHHQRLADERDAADERIVAAERAQTDQAETFADQIVTLYKSPPPELSLLEWVLASEDAPDALHRVELVAQASARGARRLDATRDVADRTVDEVRQQHVIVAGVDEAARELDRHREALTLEVGRAQDAAAAAEADAIRAVEAAEEAGESVEQAEAALEQARRTAAFAGSGEALPPVDGMVCPVGTPHGFSDSWRAPRPGGRQHMGVDIFAPRGTPIYAVEDGTVRASSNRLGGLVVYLTANDGDRYYYAHLDEVVVSSGDRVRAGDVIGANGDTGNARGTPPHLHWEVRPGGGDRVNPYPLARALCRPEHRGS